MTIMRTGSNEKYSNNWASAFGSKKSKAKASKPNKQSVKKSTNKKTTKKKAKR